METQKQNAISFLLFSCLSISIKSLSYKEKEKILSAVINRAYRDASSHVLSISTGNPRDADSKVKPDDIITEEICNLTEKTEYDKWHCKVCSRLINVYANCQYNKKDQNTELRFSYGIAQKWVNMTMKYMTILCDICDEMELYNSPFYKAFGKTINALRNRFHSPVDRYIIDAAWLYCTDIVMPLKENKSIRRNYPYSIPSEYVKPWSQWNCIEYCKFRKSLVKCLNGQSELDWESVAWINKAEK